MKEIQVTKREPVPQDVFRWRDGGVVPKKKKKIPVEKEGYRWDPQTVM